MRLRRSDSGAHRRCTADLAKIARIVCSQFPLAQMREVTEVRMGNDQLRFVPVRAAPGWPQPQEADAVQADAADREVQTPCRPPVVMRLIFSTLDL